MTVHACAHAMCVFVAQGICNAMTGRLGDQPYKDAPSNHFSPPPATNKRDLLSVCGESLTL
eukprot:1380961-Amphidinium_carterae.1